MRLKVKDMDIATGGTLVAILNEKDAQILDLHALDRVKIKKSKKSKISRKLKTSSKSSTGEKTETVVVDIAESPKAVPQGKIGLFEEVLSSLKLKNNDNVEITLARKPLSLEYIRKKLDGKKLTKKELNQIVWDIVHNKLGEIELTYFVAACYTHALDMDETIKLTRAMASHGDTLKFKRYPVIDKHSIGGVPANRTTMVLVPIIAAAGLLIPKSSSRSITSPAGTADTMEILANVSFSVKKMKKIVEKTNGCIVWGGAINLAPADDKIIYVERPLGIDAESQLLASIMAKKHSVNSTHILIDIPVGRDAKVKTKKDALKLKSDFEKIGKKLRKHIKVIITRGSEPIGNGVGPALEARDVLWILRRDKKRPLDLERKCIYMATKIFEIAGIKNSKKKALEILNSGKAYKKMKEIIKEQGGNQNIKPEHIKIGKYRYNVRSPKNGKVKDINNTAISKIARVAGAPLNKGAGLYLYKHVGDKVKKEEKLFTIYSESIQKLNYAKELLKELKYFTVR